MNIMIHQKQMLYSSLAERIAAYIREQSLQPGDKLPGERKLAAEWKVGRSSVREAIRELENQGLVRVEVGRGTFITDLAEGHQVSIHLALKNFLDIFEIKTALERYMLEKIVPVIPEERLNVLEETARRMVEIADSGEMPKEMDHQFHKYLMESYSNREMSNMVYGLIAIYESFDSELYGYCDKANINYLAILLETFPHHLDMVQHMRARDVQAALESYDRIVELDMQIYGRIR